MTIPIYRHVLTSSTGFFLYFPLLSPSKPSTGWSHIKQVLIFTWRFIICVGVMHICGIAFTCTLVGETLVGDEVYPLGWSACEGHQSSRSNILLVSKACFGKVLALLSRQMNFSEFFSEIRWLLKGMCLWENHSFHPEYNLNKRERKKREHPAQLSEKIQT